MYHKSIHQFCLNFLFDGVISHDAATRLHGHWTRYYNVIGGNNL